jgi:hypothetical protein
MNRFSKGDILIINNVVNLTDCLRIFLDIDTIDNLLGGSFISTRWNLK